MPQRLDAAYQNALDMDLIDVRRLERILVHVLNSRQHYNYPCAGRWVASSVSVASSLTPQASLPGQHEEIAHDPHYRTHSLAQKPQPGRLGREEQLDYASFLEIILSDAVNC